jgi:hypothetical protein
MFIVGENLPLPRRGGKKEKLTRRRGHLCFRNNLNATQQVIQFYD